MTAVAAVEAPSLSPEASGRAKRRRRGAGGSLLVALMVMVGVAVLLYPSGASWFSLLEQSQRVGAYAEVMEELGPEGRLEELAAAREYNGTLSGGALIDPYGGTPLSERRAIVAAYEQQLDLGPADVMARIRIPTIGVDLPIYHGTDEATLRQGIGHLLGSALPVGASTEAPGTNSVLTGHRGLPESVLFTDLDQLVVGDQFEVDVYGERLTYEVRDVQVIEPGDTEQLMPEAGRDLVTLVTCTPLGVNSHRIIVTGERIPTPPAEVAARETRDIPGAPWWAVGLAVGWGFAAGYRSLSGLPRRRRAAAPEPAPRPVASTSPIIVPDAL